jgi:hypothetical protein
MEINLADDDSFYKYQCVVNNGPDPVVVFGPLATHLSSLFEEGFVLEVSGYYRPTRDYVSYKLHLTRLLNKIDATAMQVPTKERYLLGKTKFADLLQCDQLSELIKDRVQVMRVSDCRTIEKPVRVASPNTLIGNRTLYEITEEMIERAMN